MATPRQAWIPLVIAAALPSCGGDGLSPPGDIHAGIVTITADPLRIEIAGETGSLARDRFVEIATVRSPDALRYIDPRDRGADDLTWTVPTRAIGTDADGWLVLEGGARLRVVAVGDGARLDLDASAVDGAVLERIVLPLDDGEPIHGFGESFGGADATGQVREAQFRVDVTSESGLNEAHVPVPLAMWPRRGAGLFVEDRRPGAFDLGASRPGDALATFGLPARGPLAIHLFAGAPLDLVRTYVELTAAPAVPPRWAFAPQQWRNVHDSSDEVRSDAIEMRSRGIPGSVIWIDNPWQTGYNTFVVDEERFVGIDGLLAELRGLGYRVLFWSTPYLQNQGETAADYGEARAAGYLVTDGGGGVIDFPWKDGPVGLIDFTNPDAVEFWRERIARIVDRGASGFKLDYGEDVVPEIGGSMPEIRLAAGDNQDLHGIFARYYHDTYLGALPEGDGFLITRAGAWGEQDRNTAIWPGDLDNDFSVHDEVNVGGLPAAIAGGLSLAVSGYPFYGSDIGGYRDGAPTTEALLRWAEYAALGTIMQLGGGGDSHNPWDAALYDPAAVAIYAQYARLHLDLNPYLWTLAQGGGAPITPPCRFVYPDAGCDDAMFLLGDALLVAPVIEAGATSRAVSLPPGEWISWWDGSVAEGELTAAAPLDRIPIFLAPDRFVPMFARAADTLEPATAPGVTSYADPAYGRELRLVLAPRDTATTTLHDGATATSDAGTLSFSPGTQYDIATFDLWTAASSVEALPVAADEAALFACPAPGCWLAESGRLRVRIFAIDGATHAAQVQ